jgi:WD40 repeat protein
MQSIDDLFFHKNLANFFANKPLYLDEPIQKKPNTRKLVEQPWQQTKGEMWDEVTDTLCNLDFIQAKAAAKMTYELVNDFNAALEFIPDNQENIEAEKERQARMDAYTKDLILYAKGEKKELDVPESITPWSEERIEEEIERIRRNPNNADKLKDFSYFIGSKSAILQKYASEFQYHVYDQAWHFANDGPVGKSAENISPEIRKSLLLCDQNSRPIWNPLPFALKIIQSPDSQLRSIAITPDGKQAILGGEKCCFHLSLSTGQIIKKMEGERSKTKVQYYGGSWGYPLIDEHNGSNKILSITPDGKFAFSVNSRKLYGIKKEPCLQWDISSGKIIKTLIGNDDIINAISFTPDGRWLILGSDDKTCILWDLKSGGKPKILEGHISKVTSVSIASNGKRALSVSDNYQDKPIIWDLEKGVKFRTLETPTESMLDRIESVYITPDGKLALCFGYKRLTYFDLTNGNVLKITNGITLGHGLNSLCLTSDGRRAFSAFSYDCVLWDVNTGNKLLTLSGHKGQVEAVSITPDGRFGISSSSDNTIILWDLEKGKTITENPRRKLSPFNIAITSNGKFAFGGSRDSNSNASCTLINISNRNIQHEILATPNHKNPPYMSLYNYGVNYVAITPNGQRGISGIIQYNYSTSINFNDDVLNSINVYDLLRGNIIKNLCGHTGPIADVSITEDGRYAISSSEDETCILWDLMSGERLKTFKGHDFKVNELVAIARGQGRIVDKICFTPDGKMVIFSTRRAGCRLWNLPNGEIVPITSPKGKAVSNTPDGKWVISINYYIPKAIIVWDLKSGKEFRVLNLDSKSVEDVVVSPDGKRIITVSSDGTCFLWDIESSKLISNHTSAFGIYSVKFLPQGIFLSHQYEEFGFLHSDKSMLSPGIAIATIKQIWDFELNGFTEPLVYCPLCGHRFEPPIKIINTVLHILQEAGLTSEQSPCLELPDEAWDHPELLGECPNCHEKLKFNPFFGSDQKGIEEYIAANKSKFEFQEIFDNAELAFNNEDWATAFNLYFKLVQQGQFDKNYLRYNMALCQINRLTFKDQHILNDIDILTQLLSSKGAEDKAKQITSKLKERLETIKQEELRKKAEMPWWKKLF